MDLERKWNRKWFDLTNMEKRINLMHLVIFFILLLRIGLAVSKGCPESLATLSIVSKCPHDHESWITAARRKNCESIAQMQSCSNPEDFVYHCLINNWENATVEVCAPTWFINGYCAEFNIPEGRILNHLQRDCTSSPIRCPVHYISSEAYKYPGCYLTTFSKTKTSGCNCTKNITEIELAGGRETKCTKCTEIYIPALIVLAVISAVLLILLFLLCVMYKRSEESHRQQAKNGKFSGKDSHETFQPGFEEQYMYTSSAYNTERTNTYSEGYQTYCDEGRPLTESSTCNGRRQHTPRRGPENSPVSKKMNIPISKSTADQNNRWKKSGNPEKSGRFTVQTYKDVSVEDPRSVGNLDLCIQRDLSRFKGINSLQETSF